MAFGQRPAQCVLRLPLGVEDLRGDIGIGNLEAGEGADRLERHEDVHADDDGEGGDGDRKNLAAGERFGHLSPPCR